MVCTNMPPSLSFGKVHDQVCRKLRHNFSKYCKKENGQTAALCTHIMHAHIIVQLCRLCTLELVVSSPQVLTSVNNVQ